MALLLVCLGAAVGAPARYLLDRAVTSRHGTALPWGTLGVNLLGSAVLGVLVGLAGTGALPDAVSLAVGTGLCGALTTWSTFGYETVLLLEGGDRRRALLYVAISLTLGLATALLGTVAGTALGGAA